MRTTRYIWHTKHKLDNLSAPARLDSEDNDVLLIKLGSYCTRSLDQCNSYFVLKVHSNCRSRNLKVTFLPSTTKCHDKLGTEIAPKFHLIGREKANAVDTWSFRNGRAKTVMKYLWIYRISLHRNIRPWNVKQSTKRRAPFKKSWSDTWMAARTGPLSTTNLFTNEEWAHASAILYA